MNFTLTIDFSDRVVSTLRLLTKVLDKAIPLPYADEDAVFRAAAEEISASTPVAQPADGNSNTGAASASEKEEKASAIPAPPDTSSDEDTPAITNEALRAIATTKEKTAVKGLLEKYASSKLTEIPASIRQAFMADLKALAEKAA